MTWKKPKYFIVRNINHLDEISKQRTLFRENIAKLNIEKIISIDESGFNTSIDNNIKGLSEKGKPLCIPIKIKKNQNISLIMAISSKSVINSECYETSVNSNIYFEFIKKQSIV